MVRLVAYCFLLLSLGVLSATPIAAQENAPSPDIVRGHNLYTEAMANREKFDNLKCTFTYIENAQAKTLDELRQGVFVGEGFERTGEWVIKGEKTLIRYYVSSDERPQGSEVRREPSAIAEPPTDNAPESAPLTNESKRLNEGELIGEGYSLRYMSLGAHIFGPGQNDDASYRISPFNPDIFGQREIGSPMNNLAFALRGELDYEYAGTETINGNALEVVEFGTQNTWKKTGFDPQRNYLPVYQCYYKGKEGKQLFEFNVLEAKACENGGWFPMKSQVIWLPQQENRWVRTSILTVTSLALGQVEDSDFRLEIKKGTKISNPNSMEAIVLKESESYAIADLPKLSERIVKAHAERERLRNQRLSRPLPAALSNPFEGKLIYVIGIIFLVTSIAIYFLIRRKRTSKIE